MRWIYRVVNRNTGATIAEVESREIAEHIMHGYWLVSPRDPWAAVEVVEVAA